LPNTAKVAAAEARRAMQTDRADRAKLLIGERAIAAEEARHSSLDAVLAGHQLAQAKSELALLKAGTWAPDLAVALAVEEMARTQIEQTKTDLDRALVLAPLDGKVLQVNVRPGEYVNTSPSQPLIIIGEIHKRVHVRVDIDEHDIARYRPGAPARASPRGTPQASYPLEFIRVDPYVIPKKSLTGDNSERVDTRVLQVIYALDAKDRPIYVGQQMDVFIDVGEPEVSPR
jgi:HlyD family secretion protein